jgi:hypothetical protein
MYSKIQENGHRKWTQNFTICISYKLHVRKCQLQVAFTKWLHPTELEFYQTSNNLKKPVVSFT